MKKRYAALAFVLLAAQGAAADETRKQTTTLAAGSRYEASGVQRFFLGSGYRELWTLPIDVEVLDLATFSGGLEAEKKGGGRQTLSLRLDGEDGREWKFRSVDKDASQGLDPLLYFRGRYRRLHFD